MAKTLEDLEKSRKIREEIIFKYGFIPESVWKIQYKKNKRLDQFIESQNEVAKQYHANREYANDKKLLKAFSSSNKGVRKANGKGLSIFPYHLGETIVKFYSKPDDTVFDPFMGHNSRMQIVFELGRNYIGYDISKEFMKENFKLKELLLKRCLDDGLKHNTIDIYEKDSRNIDLPENSVDMIFTSPPYWDLEFYGEEENQLGYKKSYGLFLHGLKQVLTGCSKVLKPGCYCVFNVNDFRKEGRFYSYHTDVIQLTNNLDLNIWDNVIVDWGSSIASCFASQIDERKICGKRHEYLLVFKKRDEANE